VKFALNEKGANPDFVTSYRELAKAIQNKDKAAADAALAKLHVQNLYEDAYYGLAEFTYARQWGDEAQRYAGLLRAVAEESTPRYLPRDSFFANQIAVRQKVRVLSIRPGA